MKKIFFFLGVAGFLFAADYSIIAFSTKRFDLKAAKTFIKRFPNGVVKKYTKFVEYKIEPFNSYKEAKSYLAKVKRYYKYPLIIKYNPGLGKVLYPTKNKKFIRKSVKLSRCKGECGCESKKSYGWEINATTVLKKINVKVKDYLKDVNLTKTVSQESNATQECYFPPVSSRLFYIDGYGNIRSGQKNITKLRGDSENIKIGLIYEKYFWERWKFFTDDRLILSRKHDNTKTSTDIYLDINELYIRSFCFNDDMSNVLIGRKKTKDLRSWWYDSPLDELKIFNENYVFNYEAIFATRISNETVTDDNSPKAKIKGSRYFILHGDYQYYFNHHLGGYYIYERVKPKDTTVYKRRLHFLGLDLNGIKNDVFYWLNAGYSKGDLYGYTSVKKSKGFGFDLGAKIPYNDRLAFAASYAYGSGKHNFTQPYIATNNSDYLHKSFTFRYYGNVLNPVLENIKIISLYGIYYFAENKTFIASLHNYTQDVARTTSYDTKYFYPTDGKHKNLGNEFDIVYQYLQNRLEKLKIGAGFFFGGSAYDYLSNKNAYRIFLNYRHYWK